MENTGSLSLTYMNSNVSVKNNVVCVVPMRTLLLIIFAGVVQWQNFGFPSRPRGSDSRRLLHLCGSGAIASTPIDQVGDPGPHPGFLLQQTSRPASSARTERPPPKRQAEGSNPPRDAKKETRAHRSDGRVDKKGEAPLFFSRIAPCNPQSHGL